MVVRGHRHSDCQRTANSAVYLTSFYDGAQWRELAPEPETERSGRNVLWGAKLLAVLPSGVVLCAGWRERREKWGYFFKNNIVLRGWGALPAA